MSAAEDETIVSGPTIHQLSAPWMMPKPATPIANQRAQKYPATSPKNAMP